MWSSSDDFLPEGRGHVFEYDAVADVVLPPRIPRRRRGGTLAGDGSRGDAIGATSCVFRVPGYRPLFVGCLGLGTCLYVRTESKQEYVLSIREERLRPRATVHTTCAQEWRTMDLYTSRPPTLRVRAILSAAGPFSSAVSIHHLSHNLSEAACFLGVRFLFLAADRWALSPLEKSTTDSESTGKMLSPSCESIHQVLSFC